MYLALEVAGLPQVGESLDVRLESLWSGPERVWHLVARRHGGMGAWRADTVAHRGIQWHSFSGTQRRTHLQQLLGGQALVEPLDPEGIVGRRDHCLVLGLGHRAR